MRDVDFKFDSFRDRAAGKEGQGTPSPLIECTHLYESVYSLPKDSDLSICNYENNYVTIDVYTSRWKVNTYTHANKNIYCHNYTLLLLLPCPPLH